ncbi:crossover junction endodeoxyribonuclease RuvC [bacterium]|nr:crossover junction endodeoxyribonuclease RuvC [bacterium]
MLVLGIDPGTRITGYGLIRSEGSALECAEFGVIKNSQSLPLIECYARIFEGIDEILKGYDVSTVAVESQFFYKNARSALKIGEARSAAVLPAALRRIPVMEYSPTRVKKAVVGIGAATKDQVQGMIKNMLKIKNERMLPDASDALAIALTHIHALKYPELKD